MMKHWQAYLAVILLFSLVLLAAGYIYERLGERRDARRSPPPGKLIAVDGRKLHLFCEGTGGPTVVIEQGAGELSRFWWPVQHQIAEFAQVCTYDRAGFGWSGDYPGPRSVEDRAEELRTLLKTAGLPGPYVLVAHSYGGMIVRSFVRSHPEDVAGLVLVDTPEESSIFQKDVQDFYSKAALMNRVIGTAARFSVLRVLGHIAPLDKYGFWLARPSEYAALCDDIDSLKRVPASMRESKEAGSLGALPVAVITHGIPFPAPFAVLDTGWTEGQARLAALSTNSVLVVATRSNHMIQHDEPELVVDVIRRVCNAVNISKPLNGDVAIAAK